MDSAERIIEVVREARPPEKLMNDWLQTQTANHPKRPEDINSAEEMAGYQLAENGGSIKAAQETLGQIIAARSFRRCELEQGAYGLLNYLRGSEPETIDKSAGTAGDE